MGILDGIYLGLGAVLSGVIIWLTLLFVCILVVVCKHLYLVLKIKIITNKKEVLNGKNNK